MNKRNITLITGLATLSVLSTLQSMNVEDVAVGQSTRPARGYPQLADEITRLENAVRENAISQLNAASPSESAQYRSEFAQISNNFYKSLANSYGFDFTGNDSTKAAKLFSILPREEKAVLVKKVNDLKAEFATPMDKQKARALYNLYGILSPFVSGTVTDNQ